MNFLHSIILSVVGLIVTTLALSAQNFPIPGGSLFVNDGRISGSWEDINPSFPDEVDRGSVTGAVSPTGAVGGSFSGVVTFFVNSGGRVVLVSEPYSGAFSGRIDPVTGDYTVVWTGPEPGSVSGTAPTSVVPTGTGGEVDPETPQEETVEGGSDPRDGPQDTDIRRQNARLQNADRFQEIRRQLDDSIRRIEALPSPDTESHLDPFAPGVRAVTDISATILGKIADTPLGRNLGALVAPAKTPTGSAVLSVIEGTGRALLNPNTANAAIRRIEEGQGIVPNVNERRALRDVFDSCQVDPSACTSPSDLRRKGYGD